MLSLGGPCQPAPLLRVRDQFAHGCRETGMGSLESDRNDLRMKGDKVLLFLITLRFALDDVRDVHN